MFHHTANEDGSTVNDDNFSAFVCVCQLAKQHTPFRPTRKRNDAICVFRVLPTTPEALVR